MAVNVQKTVKIKSVLKLMDIALQVDVLVDSLVIRVLQAVYLHAIHVVMTTAATLV